MHLSCKLSLLISISVANCGTPPTSSGVEIDAARSNATQTYGSQKYYVCKTGYNIMEGADGIICQANGSWSAAPLCNCK